MTRSAAGWTGRVVGLAALIAASLAVLSLLTAGPAPAQPDPRYRQAPARAVQPRQAAPGEVIYLTPPVRGQRPPPVAQQPPPRAGFRIPFLDRIFGGSQNVWSPPPQAEGAARPGQPARGSGGQPGAGPGAPGGAGSGVAQPPRPKVEPKIFVAVAGDDLAEAVAGGLEEALADRPDIAVVRKVAADRGVIARDPSFATELRDFLSSKKVDAVVVAIGNQDQKPIAEGRTEHAFRSSRWNQIYATRVDEVLIALTERRLPMIWLGLPPVADEERAAGNAHINEILRQRMIGFGASFHDVWAGFVDDAEAFAAVGPSLDGRDVRLRLADGLGFTRAGARKFAHYAEVEIRRLFPPEKIGEGAAVAVAKGDASIHVLTAPPRTAGATLLSSDLPAVRREVPGGPDGPPPGRADDFSWAPAP